MKKRLVIIAIYFATMFCFISESLAAKADNLIPYFGHLGELKLTLSFANGHTEATEMSVATQYEAIRLNFSNYDSTSGMMTLIDSSGGIMARVYIPDANKGMGVPDTVTVQLQSDSDNDYNGKTTLKSLSDYQTADAELNRVYKAVKVRYKNNKAFLQKLKESQRLWIQFRDAEVAMRYPAENKKMAYGSSYPMCAEALLAELTQARIKTLRQWLDDAVEGDVCSGSIGF